MVNLNNSDTYVLKSLLKFFIFRNTKYIILNPQQVGHENSRQLIKPCRWTSISCTSVHLQHQQVWVCRVPEYLRLRESFCLQLAFAKQVILNKLPFLVTVLKNVESRANGSQRDLTATRGEIRFIGTCVMFRDRPEIVVRTITF